MTTDELLARADEWLVSWARGLERGVMSPVDPATLLVRDLVAALRGEVAYIQQAEGLWGMMKRRAEQAEAALAAARRNRDSWQEACNAMHQERDEERTKHEVTKAALRGEMDRMAVVLEAKDHWRDRAERAERERDQANDELNSLTASLTILRERLERAEAALAESEAERAQLRDYNQTCMEQFQVAMTALADEKKEHELTWKRVDRAEERAERAERERDTARKLEDEALLLAHTRRLDKEAAEAALAKARGLLAEHPLTDSEWLAWDRKRDAFLAGQEEP